MLALRINCLLLFLSFSVAPLCYAQGVPAERADKPEQQANCDGFPGWGGHTSWGGAYDIFSGCLTVTNGAVRFQSGSEDKNSSFDFPISDLASLQKKKFKLWNGFQFKLKSGKKYDFYPFYSKNTQGPDEAAATVEKAIRDMAAQHGVVLK